MSTFLHPYSAASLFVGLGLGAAVLCAAPQPGHGQAPATPAYAMAAESVLAAPEVSVPPLAELVRADARSFGRSGQLRIAVVWALESLDAAFIRRPDGMDDVTYRWVPVLGTRPEPLGGALRFAGELRAPSVPGIWRLQLARHGEQYDVEDLTVITRVPFSQKRLGRLNGYLIGTYATEGSGRTDHYAPPAGFIEVTEENRDLYISKHLRLGQFLTKDQFDVWPKYVALDLRLIDKLELTIQELRAMGVRADRMHIMSGFRTPNYNGPGEGGRALLSRHTYGDAADVWIETGARSGYIADLNSDGRHDTFDAEVIQQAVERVEQKHPELVGGIGVYRESGARGPFVHIDVRGNRSRW